MGVGTVPSQLSYGGHRGRQRSDSSNSVESGRSEATSSSSMGDVRASPLEEVISLKDMLDVKYVENPDTSEVLVRGSTTPPSSSDSAGSVMRPGLYHTSSFGERLEMRIQRNHLRNASTDSDSSQGSFQPLSLAPHKPTSTLVHASDDPRGSTYSDTSTVSSNGYTPVPPAVISTAERVTSLRVAHNRASSLPLPQALAAHTRSSSLNALKRDSLDSPVGSDHPTTLPTLSLPNISGRPKLVEPAAPSPVLSDSQHQPPLSALSFPVDAPALSPLPGEHGGRSRASIASVDVAHFPFVLPFNCPAVPALLPKLVVPSLPKLHHSHSTGSIPTVPSPFNPTPAAYQAPVLVHGASNPPSEEFSSKLKLSSSTTRSTSITLDQTLAAFNSPASPPSPLPFPWASVPVLDAKHLLRREEMQSVVVESVKTFRDAKLVIDEFDKVDAQLESAQERLRDIEDKFQTELSNRARLLHRHVVCLRSLNGDEGARFAQTLVSGIAKSDELALRQARLSDHVLKMEQLKASHHRAAASVCIAQLNSAFSRSMEVEKEATRGRLRAEEERDEALQRLEALEKKLAQFADQEGKIVVEGISRPPSQSLGEDTRHYSSSTSTPKTAVSFHISDLTVSSHRFPKPPSFRSRPFGHVPKLSLPANPRLGPRPQLERRAPSPASASSSSTPSPGSSGSVGYVVSPLTSNSSTTAGQALIDHPYASAYLFPRPAPIPSRPADGPFSSLKTPLTSQRRHQGTTENGVEAFRDGLRRDGLPQPPPTHSTSRSRSASEPSRPGPNPSSLESWKPLFSRQKASDLTQELMETLDWTGRDSPTLNDTSAHGQNLSSISLSDFDSSKIDNMLRDCYF
ncbi:hypothetical protein MNV49_003720 [Pseudohyphozyma bogoriensis]|nr:hypothetical protein MNV49_003720 [Pseudohyphozyma bogoriensis]